MKHALTIAAFAALLLAACDRQPPATNTAATPAAPVATPDSATATSAAPAGPQVAISRTDAFWSEPAALACGKAGKVTLNWNTRQTPGAARVDIYVVARDGKEKLFASRGGGGVGSVDTGPWVREGMQFSLRSKQDGVELARIAVDGSACPASAKVPAGTAASPTPGRT